MKDSRRRRRNAPQTKNLKRELEHFKQRTEVFLQQKLNAVRDINNNRKRRIRNRND